MAMSAKQIQALADDVSAWRMQEYIFIPFYCFYVYYVLTTIAEEVSIILPQKWSRGKVLYMIMRYGLLFHIALQLSRDYRNYLSISLGGCKALAIIDRVIYFAVVIICDFSLGICLGALLQAKRLYLAAISLLSCGIPFVNGVISLVSDIQYPAEPLSRLDTELGYPCYYVSSDQFTEGTIAFVGRDIRTYINLVTTALLAALGIITLAVRYRGRGGHLIQVMRRDGGIHYLSLLAVRLALAIVRTPAVLSVSDLDGNPVFILARVTNETIVTILAQRLLINMRKVDYMGSEPVASKLLFAQQGPDSEDDLEGDSETSKMGSEGTGVRRWAATREGPKERKAGEKGTNV